MQDSREPNLYTTYQLQSLKLIYSSYIFKRNE